MLQAYYYLYPSTVKKYYINYKKTSNKKPINYNLTPVIKNYHHIIMSTYLHILLFLFYAECHVYFITLIFLNEFLGKNYKYLW